MPSSNIPLGMAWPNPAVPCLAYGSLQPQVPAGLLSTLGGNLEHFIPAYPSLLTCSAMMAGLLATTAPSWNLSPPQLKSSR
jgi:hypothetical protein